MSTLFFEDSPTLVFSSLSTFISDNIKSNNLSVLMRLIYFIDEILVPNDPSLNAVIDDLTISLYDESKTEYSKFRGLLSNKTLAYFDETISLWTQQFNVKEDKNKE